MELINHSINWCKGEIFEGKMSLLFGAIILLVSLAYWKFGSTLFAKSMVIPLALVAFLTMAIGIYLNTANQRRITSFPQTYQIDPKQFAADEKIRTEGFIKWYPYTQYIMAAIMVLGMGLMILTHSANWRAIGIGLMLFAFYTFVLDHFSEERAATYHQHILDYL
ncbi:MAG: hypothetical protein ACR2MX_18910 [Cyclobacteriaceae bacterium]